MKNKKILVFSDLHETKKEDIENILKSTYDCIFVLGDITIFQLNIIKNYAKENNKEIFGVVGNHDKWNYLEEVGIRNLHLKKVNHLNMIISGIAGCVQYKENSSCPQLSQLQSFALLDNLDYADILISHTSPYGINENHDIGYQGINHYIQKQKPKYIIHGHQHINKITKINDTIIIGVFEFQIINVEL